MAWSVLYTEGVAMEQPTVLHAEDSAGFSDVKQCRPVVHALMLCVEGLGGCARAGARLRG